MKNNEDKEIEFYYSVIYDKKFKLTFKVQDDKKYYYKTYICTDIDYLIHYISEIIIKSKYIELYNYEEKKLTNFDSIQIVVDDNIKADLCKLLYKLGRYSINKQEEMVSKNE